MYTEKATNLLLSLMPIACSGHMDGILSMDDICVNFFRKQFKALKMSKQTMKKTSSGQAFDFSPCTMAMLDVTLVVCTAFHGFSFFSTHKK